MDSPPRQGSLEIENLEFNFEKWSQTQNSPTFLSQTISPLHSLVHSFIHILIYFAHKYSCGLIPEREGSFLPTWAQNSSPFFSGPTCPTDTPAHPHTCFSHHPGWAKGGFWTKLLVSLAHLHDLAPDTICTWLFSWSASRGVAAGDENGRFLIHSSIRKIFLVRRTNKAAKKNGHLNASSEMGLMRKSQPASSTATDFESGSNSSSQRTLNRTGL